MIIEDPRLAPFSISFDKGSYSIRKLINTKPKDESKENYDRTKYVCQANSMSSAVEKIIQLKIESKNKDKAVSLIEYYMAIKEMRDSMASFLDIDIFRLEERIVKLEKLTSK